MTCYGITPDGLTVYVDGRAVLVIASGDFPALIERLAAAMREANTSRRSC